MPRPSQFFFDFTRAVDYMLSQVRGVSRWDFVRLYDYDDFLEREAAQCKTARELATAFASRFLGSVNPAYFQVLSFALVRFLARQSGRAVDDGDTEALKALAEIEPEDQLQLEQWLDAYFPDLL
jgi:hypothetical protein